MSEDCDGDFDVGWTKASETKCCGQLITRHEDATMIQWKCDICNGSYDLIQKGKQSE